MAAKDFLLPDLGEGLEEAEIVTWRVAEGDRVELNQPLVEVNTAKALVEIPSPFEGVVVRLHAAEGDVVDVGKPLVTIDVGATEASSPEERTAPTEPSEAASPAEAVQEGVQEAQEAPPRRRPVLVGYGVADEEEPEARAAPAADRGTERSGPVAASPPVRRLAKHLGVDLAAVEGSGPNGRVTREDVEQAAQGTEGAPSEEAERIPVRGTRRLVAEKMTRSARDIPHVTTFLTVDAHWLEEYRRELSTESGERVSALPVIVRALAEVVRDHPKLNASFDADRSEVVLHSDCHVGIATDTERGLLVPVVRDVRRKGVRQVAGDIAELARSARDGTIGVDQMSGGTMTVTNVGSFGAEFGTPIINHPEGAILATGVTEQRALVVDGEVVARPAMTLSLSFDHRLLDGAEAGRALRALGDFLESPFSLGSLPR
jgi:2-oxoisovalerate dehydrogenase E2 component (dihydrolipoyl transacylase)